MLETYHDGTQEVVGTTFIDDCQWDRLSEYPTGQRIGNYYSCCLWRMLQAELKPRPHISEHRATR